MKRRIFLVLTLAVTVSMTLCGCSMVGRFGRIPSKRAVEKKVKEFCPTEELEWTGQDKESGFPRKVTYHISSKERDLSFDAVSTLNNWTMFHEEDTPFYTRQVEVGYVEAVHDYYWDDFCGVLGSLTGHNSVFFNDESEFPAIAKYIVAASDVYAAEKQYNTEEWMKENPIGDVALVWAQYPEDPQSGKRQRTIKIDIDGCLTYDEVLERITDAYNEKVRDGSIPDNE